MSLLVPSLLAWASPAFNSATLCLSASSANVESMSQASWIFLLSEAQTGLRRDLLRSSFASMDLTLTVCTCGLAQLLVEAERLRPSLELLLAEADYVFTSAKFPQVSQCAAMRKSVTCMVNQFGHALIKADYGLPWCQRWGSVCAQAHVADGSPVCLTIVVPSIQDRDARCCSSYCSASIWRSLCTRSTRCILFDVVPQTGKSS